MMKQKNWKYRMISLALCCVMTVTSLIGGISVQAATFEEINQSSVFLKQPTGSNTCTLVSATMLVRRAAMLNGNENWSELTTDVMRSAAWVTGKGLKHSFNCNGIYVENSSFSGEEQDLIALLAAHPEGIVIYDRAKPHAILVTDYTNGVFYAADPSPAVAEGRVPISSATVTVAGADDIWYVKEPSLYLTDSSGNILSKEEVSITPAASAGPTSNTDKNSSSSKAMGSSGASADSTNVKAPAKVTGVKVKNKAKKSVKVSWKALSAARGYEILYADNVQFKKYKYIYLQQSKHSISKLKKGKVYYIKVRAYKKNGDALVYGKWSAVKKVKIKK